MVNEMFARRYWSDPAQAIGKRMKSPNRDSPWMTIVGATRDIKHYGLDREMRPGTHLPFDARPNNSMAIVLRSSVEPASLTSASREIGIRMALGAQQTQVLRQVLQQGMKLALAGMLCGLTCAFWVARLLEKLLLGVSAHDPLTYAGVATLLAVIAILSNLMPARRAARTDPLRALRFE
jgi:hypothetical protein